MFSRIVLATDFSPSSDRAYAVALELATHYKTKVFVLHVVHPPRWSTYADPLAELDIENEVAGKVMDALGTVVQRFSRAGVEVVARHRVGDARVVIVQFAREVSAHAILLASHGHGGLYERVLGGTTDRVVRRAGCPVLVASGHMSAEGPFGFDRVLFPTDLSPASMRHAESLTEALAPALKELHLLHVAPLPTSQPVFPGELPVAVSGPTLEKMVEVAEVRLAAMREHLAKNHPGLILNTAVRLAAMPTATIMDYRSEAGLGLIAIPASGQSAEDPHYLGRTAEALLGKARVPVLVLK